MSRRETITVEEARELIAVNQQEVRRLARGLRSAARAAGPAEARAVVDTYYQMQRYRIALANQRRQVREETDDAPLELLTWLFGYFEAMEEVCRDLMREFVEAHPVGPWLLGVKGVGPVIAAGLLAHIDIRRCNSPSALWRFAGLAPPDTYPSGKGVPRGFNQRLKVLLWKFSDSMVKMQQYDDAFYARLYQRFKAEEVARNEAGGNAERAAHVIDERPTHKQAKTYAEGRLPDGHVDMRARRRVAKVFLAHLFHVWYWTEFKRQPPAPYAFAQLAGHTDYIAPPNWTEPEGEESSTTSG